jgi:hypothetical protein
MSKRVYFVVAVDLTDEQIYLDDEAFMARFDKDQQVWDTEAEAWEGFSDEAYGQALAILNSKTIAKDGN